MPGDRIERDAGEVGEVGEERAVGHVLAEGHPVHLLEHPDDAAVGAPGHDLVAEGRRAHRCRHPDEQRRVQPPGQPGEQHRLGRAGQRSGQGDHVLGPHHQLRSRVGMDALHGGDLRVVHRGRRDLLLAHAAGAAPLDEGRTAPCPPGAPRRAPRAPANTRATRPAAATSAPTAEGAGRLPARARAQVRQRGQGHAAGVHAGRHQQGAAQAGQLQQRAVGLTQEHSAQRKPAEGPGHAQRLGQGAGADEGQRPGRGRAGCRRRPRRRTVPRSARAPARRTS